MPKFWVMHNDTAKMLYMKRALRDAPGPACDNKHKV